MAREHRDHLSMVTWFGIKDGLPVGINAAISTIMGTRFDYRLLESLSAGLDEKLFDHAGKWEEGEAFWFDYMADTGDGWDSTCSMARLLARDSLDLPEGAENEELSRGKFLVLGGDEVYPYASRDNYRKRLVEPFRQACVSEGFELETEQTHGIAQEGGKLNDADKPFVYAIPGNHDWYDGLQSFMRRFTQEGRPLGIWKRRQQLSYFALKLPYGWWLWGIDTHLESDIDKYQLKFFEDVAENEMEDNDRLIMCTAEPYWIYGELDPSGEYERNLDHLLNQLHRFRSGVKAWVFLAGDLHLYRRHETESPPHVQRIVSGGGGAFLHPTHRGGVDQLFVKETNERRKYVMKAQFPSEKRSWLLSLRNLLFPIWNPIFGFLTAGAYLALGYGLRVDSLSNLHVATDVPWFRAAIVMVLCGIFCRAAENTRAKAWAYLWGGLAHGLAHVAAAVLLAIGFTALLAHWALPILPESHWRFVFLIASGYVVGSVIMGIYLLLSLTLFGLHRNEAFSALRIPHYKNFLRIRINPDRTLDIFPIGLQCVRKDAKEVDDPILIEAPIHVNPDAE